MEQASKIIVRTDAAQFQDSISGDVRLIRSAGKRWFVWTREPGNEWKRQHKTPLNIGAGVKVAQAFVEVRALSLQDSNT